MKLTPPIEKIYPLGGDPGVKRDGTEFQGNFYTSAEWCRWRRGLPQKIGGYQYVSEDFSGPVRGMNVATRGGLVHVHGGSANVLEKTVTDMNGTPGGIVDRTPVGFATSSNNSWQFAVMWDAVSSAQQIIAHAAPNLQYIDNDVETPAYIGDVYGSAPLTAISSSDCSGGVCVLRPYLFTFGNDGVVNWSVANTPSDMTGLGSGTARVAGGKIIAGNAVQRGSGNGPAGLFWATDSLVSANFTGGPPVFGFQEISEGYSVLSSKCMVEYDGVWFWPGLGRFLAYNGVIREMKNQMNVDWFFSNLNWEYSQKVTGMRNEQYDEIWWMAPLFGATENNWAIVYNVPGDFWYDTPIHRSVGAPRKVFRWPLMFGNEPNTLGKVTLWRHEIGYDKVTSSSTIAVPSSFTTPNISLCGNGPLGNQVVGEDRNIIGTRFEPDFVQSGDLSLIFSGREYAQSDLQISEAYTMPEGTEKVDIREQYRQMNVTVASNTQGGNYVMGMPLIKMQVGDAAPAAGG